MDLQSRLRIVIIFAVVLSIAYMSWWLVNTDLDVNFIWLIFQDGDWSSWKGKTIWSWSAQCEMSKMWKLWSSKWWSWVSIERCYNAEWRESIEKRWPLKCHPCPYRSHWGQSYCPIACLETWLVIVRIQFFLVAYRSLDARARYLFYFYLLQFWS